MMASAVILNWKRPHNIPKIVENLLKQPMIDEILIADNSKGQNLICARRFTMAAQAKNEIIYTQDDDCMVNDIPKLAAEFSDDPTRIVCGGTTSLMQHLGEHPYSDTNLALLCWGAFFQKRWMSNLSRYLSVYPEDWTYQYLADRIFTLLMPTTPKVVHVPIDHLPGFDGPEAMCSDTKWRELREVAIQRCKNL